VTPDSGRRRGVIALNARAAARPELGGVERWARELAARGGYEVLRPPAALSHRAGHAWEQLVLPLRARRARLLLNPANLAPVAFPRNAVIIHDAAALREPAWYSPAYAAWQRRVLPAIARRARVVITVSEFSRRELRELLGVEAHVVPGGVDARFRPDADPEPARAALGLARPYVLTVASRTPRKNLAALDVAGARLAARGIELVAAGGERPQFGAPAVRGGGAAGGERPQFRASATRGEGAAVARGGGAGAAAPPRHVRSLGPVPDEHLPGLYAGARAFVLPSLHEGFGLTCLEAMACGVPVVAADAGALPETCGEAARYADPHDPEAIADAIDQALDDDALRAAGPRRAREFTWERTIAALDALLGPRS
jgi:glycosyltransferase involved in cell wall biosynthesis